MAVEQRIQHGDMICFLFLSCLISQSWKVFYFHPRIRAGSESVQKPRLPKKCHVIKVSLSIGT